MIFEETQRAFVQSVRDVVFLRDRIRYRVGPWSAPERPLTLDEFKRGTVSDMHQVGRLLREKRAPFQDLINEVAGLADDLLALPIERFGPEIHEWLLEKWVNEVLPSLGQIPDADRDPRSLLDEAAREPLLHALGRIDDRWLNGSPQREVLTLESELRRLSTPNTRPDRDLVAKAGDAFAGLFAEHTPDALQTHPRIGRIVGMIALLPETRNVSAGDTRKILAAIHHSVSRQLSPPWVRFIREHTGSISARDKVGSALLNRLVTIKREMQRPLRQGFENVL